MAENEHLRHAIRICDRADQTGRNRTDVAAAHALSGIGEVLEDATGKVADLIDKLDDVADKLGDVAEAVTEAAGG